MSNCSGNFSIFNGNKKILPFHCFFLNDMKVNKTFNPRLLQLDCSLQNDTTKCRVMSGDIWHKSACRIFFSVLFVIHREIHPSLVENLFSDASSHCLLWCQTWRASKDSVVFGSVLSKKINNTKSGILRYFNLTHDTSITSKANPRPAQIVCHHCVISSPTYAENCIFIPLKIIPQFGITHPDGPKIAFSECRINAAEGTGLNVRDWDCLSSKSDVRWLQKMSHCLTAFITGRVKTHSVYFHRENRIFLKRALPYGARWCMYNTAITRFCLW